MQELPPILVSAETRMSVAKKRRKPIGDLPPGITVSKLGNGYFRVRIGKRFTDTVAEVRDFPKLDAAQKWISEQIKDRDARRGMQLTSTQIAQAKSAFQRLGDIPLEIVVEYYFKSGPGKRETMRLKDATKIYIQHHHDAGNKAGYIRAQETSMKVMIGSLGNRELSHITAQRLDAWLRKISLERQWGELNLLNYARDYRMFFKFCMGRDLIPRNPFDDHLFIWLKKTRKRIKENGKSVEIYTVEECKRLLNAALNHPELHLLPWFTTAFFTGARVDELEKLTWDLFRWEDKIVSIPKGVASKRGSARHIEFTDAFESWIAHVPDLRDKTGDICIKTNMRNRLDALYRFAEVPKKRNGLRHTFASYYYVSTDDADLTRRRMGQRTEQILFDHYVSLVDKKEATAFWALRPETEAPKDGKN